MINVEKSQPGPQTLIAEKKKVSGTYRLPEVIDGVKRDFCDKCYICESKDLSAINIEHFVPHRGDVDLKFDWNNLFYSCYHCNNTKLAVSTFDNILNCTDPNDDVEGWIYYKIDPFPRKYVQVKALHADVRVANTVELLRRVYNGTTTELKNAEAASIRKLLIREVLAFQQLLFDYEECDPSETIRRADIRDKISRHLRKWSAFTAFKRWIIKEDQELAREFAVEFPHLVVNS